MNMSESIVADLTLSPRGPNLVSLSKVLKPAIQRLKENPNLKIFNHAMGTNLEAKSLDIIFDAVKDLHEYFANQGLPRIVTNLKIDHRFDSDHHSIAHKVQVIDSE